MIYFENFSTVYR